MLLSLAKPVSAVTMILSLYRLSLKANQDTHYKVGLFILNPKKIFSIPLNHSITDGLVQQTVQIVVRSSHNLTLFVMCGHFINPLSFTLRRSILSEYFCPSHVMSFV